MNMKVLEVIKKRASQATNKSGLRTCRKSWPSIIKLVIDIQKLRKIASRMVLAHQKWLQLQWDYPGMINRIKCLMLKPLYKIEMMINSTIRNLDSSK